MYVCTILKWRVLKNDATSVHVCFQRCAVRSVAECAQITVVCVGVNGCCVWGGEGGSEGVHMPVCVYCTCVCVHMRIYVCIHVFTCTYMCSHVHTCLYMYADYQVCINITELWNTVCACIFEGQNFCSIVWSANIWNKCCKIIKMDIERHLQCLLHSQL